MVGKPVLDKNVGPGVVDSVVNIKKDYGEVIFAPSPSTTPDGLPAEVFDQRRAARSLRVVVNGA